MKAAPQPSLFQRMGKPCLAGCLTVGVHRIRHGLDENARAKVDYFCFDVKMHYVRETEQSASTLGLHSCHGEVGTLSKFPVLYPQKGQFDLITLTNTVHEVEPIQVATMLIDSLVRLNATGCLYVYDMEDVAPPELGAVPWLKADVSRVLESMFAALGVNDYRPYVRRWHHRNCYAWDVQLHRKHLKRSGTDLRRRRNKAIVDTTEAVRLVLKAKLERCVRILEETTQFGRSTIAEADGPDDDLEKQRRLYEFWAVSRALRSE